MKFINDKKLLILVVILLLFTIGYFTFVNKISYAFVNDYDTSFYYNQIENIIKQSAIKYAKEHPENFDDGVEYITVQKLIEFGYLIPDENGNIEDPTKKNSTFNQRQVYIKQINDNFEVKIEPESI